MARWSPLSCFAPTLFLLALALGMPALPASAGDAAVLRIGSCGDYPPFTHRIPADGTALGFEGFDLDVGRAFAEASNRKFVVVPTTWSSLTEDLLAGRFDVAMGGITVRSDRSLAGRFTVPVAESGALVLLQPSIATRSLDELNDKGARLVVNRGGHLERVATQQFPRASLATLPDNDAVHMALLDRSFDGVVTDTFEAETWDPERKHARVGPFTRDRKAYLVSMDNPELATALDEFLMQAEADGRLLALRKKWFGSLEQPATASPLAAVLAAMQERLALMPAVARAKAASGKPIEDLAREALVLDKAVEAVANAAKSAGVKPPQELHTRRFFEAMIVAAKDMQHATQKADSLRERRLRANGRPLAPKDAKSMPALEQDLRPALLAIGERVARTIVRLDRPISAAYALKQIEASLAPMELPKTTKKRLSETLSKISQR